MKARLQPLGALAGIALVVALICVVAAWMHACLAGTCANPFIGGVVATAVGIGALLSTYVVLIMLRTLWLFVAARAAVARLSDASWPSGLHEAANRAGVSRVRCLADDEPLAFCSGVLRPTVHVTDTLVDALSIDELTSVLVHEGHHARRRDPMRQALLRSLADVFFYMPVVRVWARRLVVTAELEADRAAIRRLGRVPLAGALWVVSGSGAKFSHLAVASVMSRRVDQLTGERSASDRPSHHDVARSVIGLAAATLAVLCALPVLVP